MWMHTVWLQWLWTKLAGYNTYRSVWPKALRRKCTLFCFEMVWFILFLDNCFEFWEAYYQLSNCFQNVFFGHDRDNQLILFQYDHIVGSTDESVISTHITCTSSHTNQTWSTLKQLSSSGAFYTVKSTSILTRHIRLNTSCRFVTNCLPLWCSVCMSCVWFCSEIILHCRAIPGVLMFCLRNVMYFYIPIF